MGYSYRTVNSFINIIMDNFKQSIPDKVAEWVLVRTKG